MELVLVLDALFTCFLNDGPSVGGQSIDDATAIESNRIKSLVRSRHHHLVDNNLLGTEDDTIFALNAQNSAEPIFRLTCREQLLLTLNFQLPSQHTQLGTVYHLVTTSSIRNRTKT